MKKSTLEMRPTWAAPHIEKGVAMHLATIVTAVITVMIFLGAVVLCRDKKTVWAGLLTASALSLMWYYLFRHSSLQQVMNLLGPDSSADAWDVGIGMTSVWTYELCLFVSVAFLVASLLLIPYPLVWQQIKGQTNGVSQERASSGIARPTKQTEKSIS